MKVPPAVPSDLILDVGQIERMTGPNLIDAPRIDRETGPAPFNWRPTVLVVAFCVLLMVAVAFL